MIRVLFICHGNICKNPVKLRGSGLRKVSAIPVSLDVTKNHESRLNL